MKQNNNSMQQTEDTIQKQPFICCEYEKGLSDKLPYEACSYCGKPMCMKCDKEIGCCTDCVQALLPDF